MRDGIKRMRERPTLKETPPPEATLPGFDPDIMGAYRGADGGLPEGMLTEDEVSAAASAMLDRAKSFYTSVIAPKRQRAQELYDGLYPSGAEAKAAGRNHITTREVSDALRVVMPSLMRILFGGERYVQFQAWRPQDVAAVEQATDYISQVVIQLDNPGRRIFYTALKEALKGDAGVVKWWAEQAPPNPEEEYLGIHTAQLQLLGQTHEVLMAEPLGPDTWHVLAVRRFRDTIVRFDVVPGEELFIDPNAARVQNADYIFHQRVVTISDLVALGFNPEALEPYIGDGIEDGPPGGEHLARQGNRQHFHRHDALSEDLGSQRVLFTEGYVKLDLFGDGQRQIWKISSIGSQLDTLRVDDWEDPVPPFAHLTADPEAHQWDGRTLAELLEDVQRVTTYTLRGILDSLGESLDPGGAFLDGAVEVDDLKNKGIGRWVRIHQQGALEYHPTPFVGADAVPLLQLFKQIGEQRTGVNDQSSSATAELWQSTTRAAVTAAVTAAQAQVELMAGMIAEGVRDLMLGLYRTVRRHQDYPRMVQLRGEFVPVNPSNWAADPAVKINVILGAGLPEDRKAALLSVLAEQKEMMAQLGLENPIAGIPEYRNTMAKLLELEGIQDVDQYIKPVPSDWTPPPPPPPPPDPNLLIAQAEVQNAQTQARKVELEGEKARMDDDRERDKIYVEAKLKAAEIEAKHTTAIDVERIRRSVNLTKGADDA